ncbi:MAG: molybdopterin cofactor-binding domain-containing protein [Oceanicoccus sp.]
MNRQRISRREMIKFSMLVSGSMLITIRARSENTSSAATPVSYFNSWLEITPNNTLIFSLDKVEMGQGVVNSLVTILAEEINTHPSLIDVRMPELGSARTNPHYEPSWGTGASSSVRSLWPSLRYAGASLHGKLVLAASKLWELEEHQVTIKDRVATNMLTGTELPFSYFLNDISETPDSQKVSYKPQDQYSWVGIKIPSRDDIEKTTGRAEYCSDISLDQLPVAVLIRRLHSNQKVKKYSWLNDSAPANISVVTLSDSVALVGKNYYEVNAARQFIKVEWTDAEALSTNNKEINANLISELDKPGEEVFSKAWAPISGNQTINIAADYSVPYLAHAPLEAMNCVVVLENGSWKIWAPTQKPREALKIAQRISGLPANKVELKTTYIGGAFGRRLKQDYVEEACKLAKQLGHSVKVLWSREDDFQHGFYRPAMSARLSASMDAHGNVSQIVSRIVSSEPKPNSNHGGSWLEQTERNIMRLWRQVRGKPAYNSQAIEGLHSLPYKIPLQSIQLSYLNVGIPTALWRSVGNSYNGFFLESFVDELAHAANQDPIEFRLNLNQAPRLDGVLNQVRQFSGWSDSSDWAGKGVAMYRCFGTAVAMVVKLQRNKGLLQISDVWCTVDCGLTIDPDGVCKQIEGGINYGLCAALYGELEIENGQVISSNFHDYSVLRIDMAPDIHVQIVSSNEAPTGVGEPATPLIAPALCNAIFDATGTRYRHLPLSRKVAGILKT